MFRTTRVHLGALLITAALALGCEDEPAPAPAGGPNTGAATKPPAGKADKAVKDKAAELASQVTDGAFPAQEQSDKTNAEAFVYLASTHQKSAVVAAALKGMASTFTSNDKVKNRVMITDQYHKVVLSKLNDKDPKVQAAALEAAGNSVSGASPSQPIIKALVDLAAHHPEPAGRYAVLEQLWKIRDIQKDPAEVAPFIKALDAKEPWLVSGALFRLKSMALGYPNKDELTEKVTALLQHEDPGVRGRAADVLAATVGNDDKRRQEAARLIQPLLADQNPYTKSAACSALAWMRYLPAAHQIIKMVDDETKNTYDIREWTQLDGQPGWVHHDGSAWSRVGDAALYALMMLSNKTSLRFDYKIEAKTVDEDLKKAAKHAKAWYAKVKSEIPAE